MTETLSRPTVRPSPPPGGGVAEPGLGARGAVVAVGAALRGLALLALVCGLVWWAEDRSGSDLLDVGRAAGQLWLVAHGTWLEAPWGRLGLTPLGLTLLPLLLCRRAGRLLAEQRPEQTRGRVALAVAAPYAAVTTVVAVVASGSSLRPMPGTAAVGGLLVALAGAAWGARAARPGRTVSERARACWTGGIAAVATLLAAAAALTAVALVMDGGTATDLAEATEPGAVGGLGLVLLGAALAPNAVVCAAAWLAGPGFAVGAGTSVTPFGTELGAVPALPLLAALPGGQPPSWAVAALLVPVVAGVVAGRLLRRRSTARSWWDACGTAAGSGLVAGGLLAASAALAAGPLGGERLTAVGPSAWQVGLVVAGQVAVGAVVGALSPSRRAGGRSGS